MGGIRPEVMDAEYTGEIIYFVEVDFYIGDKLLQI